MTLSADERSSDGPVQFHARHRKRLGWCLRCLRRYPCGAVRAYERGYVHGWEAVENLQARRAEEDGWAAR